MTRDARHILMVLESWGEGGTESFVRQLTEWLTENTDVCISVCLLSADAAIRQATVQALPIAARDVHALGGANAGSAFLRFLRLLRRLRPDVCHLHLYSSLLPAVAATRWASVPRIVTTLHMPLWNWGLRHRLAWRLAIALSHEITGNSSATLRSVGRWSAGDQTALIPPPLPATLLTSRLVSSDERPKNVSPQTFRIGGAGRLAPEKCWSDLIRAFAQLANEADTGCELCLYGDGSERESLRMLAEELGVAARVRFNNFLPQRELHDAISECDVFVLPSRFEGLGMVAIEAMALGVPTITADFEASEDYIKHGVTGHQFSRGDAKALAELLEWYRAHPKEAAAIAKRGQSFVRERFHPDVQFKVLEELYSMLGGD